MSLQRETLLLVLLTASASSQTTAECKIDEMPKDGKCQITVSFPAAGTLTEAPLALRVPGRVQVTLRVDKLSPVHACSIEKKEEAVPEGSVAAGLLSLLTPVAGLFNFPKLPIQFLAQEVTDTGSLSKLLKAAQEQQKKTVGQIVAKDDYFRLLRSSILALNKEPEATFQKHKEELLVYLTLLDELTPQSMSDAGPVVSKECRDQSNLAACLKDLGEAGMTAESLMNGQLPGLEFSTEAVKLASKFVEKLLPVLGPDKLAQVASDLDRLGATNRTLTDAVDRLKEKLKTLRELRGAIESFRAVWYKDFPFRAASNLKVTGSASCKNSLTGAVSLEPTPYSITFQGLPRVTLSAGFLVSSLDKRGFSVAADSITQTTATNAMTGATTTTNTVNYKIAEDNSRIQTMPFSLVNLRVADWQWAGRSMTFNLSPGLGVNPGNRELEFGLGPSLGIGSAQVFAGVHLGRETTLDPRFSVGPSPALVKDFTVPVNRVWGRGFSFGLLYRLPLK